MHREPESIATNATRESQDPSRYLQNIAEILPSPRHRRLVEMLQQELSANRVALLLGAGVDQAISKTPGWTALVEQLFPARYKPPQELLSGWVTELAAAARQYRGDNDFFDAIAGQVGSPTVESPMQAALSAFAPRVPLVVTTNYSSIVAHAVAKDGRVNLVERRTLRSARLPEPGAAAKVPTVVHIHGRGQESVLDKIAYDEAEYLDLLYRDFLNQLFERWTVLAIGFSFSDLPFRAAASLAQARRPERKQVHVWFDKQSHDLRHRWHSRAARLCYSVARVEVREYEDVARLAEVVANGAIPNTKAASIAIQEGDFDAIANALDLAGDYESIFQRSLFSDLEQARKLTLAMLESLASNGADLVTLARIERHLRHHLYFLKSHGPAKEDGKQMRKRLWECLATHLERNSKLAHSFFGNPQLHFDFLMGGLESLGLDSFLKIRRMLGQPGDSLLRQRLCVAQLVWGPADEKPLVRGTAELRRRACDVGWESVESKLALQEAKNIAECTASGTAGRITAKAIDGVIRACEMSIRASQNAGTLHRELGSYILKSFWVPSDAEARVLMRGVVMFARDAPPLDSTLVGAIAMAWQCLFDNPDEAFREVGWKSPPGEWAIDTQRNFWRKFDPELRPRRH